MNRRKGALGLRRTLNLGYGLYCEPEHACRSKECSEAVEGGLNEGNVYIAPRLETPADSVDNKTCAQSLHAVLLEFLQ